MMLRQVLQDHAAPIDAAAKSYQENAVTVNTLMIEVLATGLPKLTDKPPNYRHFVEVYENCLSDSMRWVRGVWAVLSTTPEEILKGGEIISQALNDAKGDTSSLIKDPTNENKLRELRDDLERAERKLHEMVNNVEYVLGRVQSFKSNLPTLASDLQGIADESVKSVGADQSKIDELLKDIASLRDDIKQLNAEIVALAIAAGVAITIGAVAVLTAGVFGIVVWPFVGVAVAAAIYAIELCRDKIKEDKRKIAADTAKLQDFETDVAALKTCAQTFKYLASSAAGTGENLQAILTEWKALERDINAVTNDIKEASAEADQKWFEGVLADLNASAEHWQVAYAHAGKMTILPAKVNTAHFEVGMSSQEVQEALATGEEIDLIDYLDREMEGLQLARQP